MAYSKKHSKSFDFQPIIDKLSDSDKRTLALTLMPGTRFENEVRIPAVQSFAHGLLRGIKDPKYIKNSAKTLAGNAHITRKKEVFIINQDVGKFSMETADFNKLTTEHDLFESGELVLDKVYRYIGDYKDIPYYIEGRIGDALKSNVD